MAKYKCIRKCHWNGKRWYENDIVESANIPPHHFIEIEKEAVPTVSILKTINDPMKPINAPEVNSLSEAANMNTAPQGGFASSMKAESPVTSMKQMKRPRAPKNIPTGDDI